MSDLIEVELGAPPWTPSPSAVIVEVFNEYDRPLLGVVNQGGTNFIFRCLAGEVETFNVWMFTVVHDEEIARLNATATDEQFEQALAEAAQGRSVVLATAQNDRVIATVAGPDFADATDLLNELFNRQSDVMRELVDGPRGR